MICNNKKQLKPTVKIEASLRTDDLNFREEKQLGYKVGFILYGKTLNIPTK